VHHVHVKAIKPKKFPTVQLSDLRQLEEDSTGLVAGVVVTFAKAPWV
jgi:hypothetical protein